MLCRVCLDMTQDRSANQLMRARSNNLRPLYCHHVHPSSIETSAKAGCEICKILWDWLSDADQERLRQAKNNSSIVAIWNEYRATFGSQEPSSVYGWTKVHTSSHFCQVRFQFGYWGSPNIDIYFLPPKCV